MAERRTAERTPEERQGGGALGWIRKLDDAVFAVEQSIVAFCLVTITAVIFVDVVARRITAPDSKVGELIAKIARIEDLETRDWIGAHVAPWVTVVLTLLLVTFAVYSGRRFARERVEGGPAPLGRELGIGAAIAAAVTAGGWGFALGFTQLESRVVYAGLFGLSALGLVAHWVRHKPKGWQTRTAAAAISGAALVWVSLSHVPTGYTWSKRVSLMLVLWVGMLSASICVYAGKHIRIEAASKLVPDGAKRWVAALSGVGGALFCGLMAYLGFRYVFALEASDDEYLTEAFRLGGTRYVYSYEGAIGRGGHLEGTDIPDWLGVLAAPLGFGVATFRFLGFSVSSILGGSYGAPAADEGLQEAKAASHGAPQDGDRPAPAVAKTAAMAEGEE